MFRYVLAALILKMFSANSVTKALYRKIGNILGQEIMKRENIDYRIIIGNLFVDICNKYSIVNLGDRLLEIGTGWIHWFSIYLRLYFDVSITMFDIWDNRYFFSMKSLFSKLKTSIKKDHANYDRIVKILEKILSANSFEELYKIFDLEYIIDKTGRLDQFPDKSFNCVFSSQVLEHIPPNQVNEEVSNIYRILKLGGYSIHAIGIDDHLSHYDKKESPKNYLRYSDKTWNRFFKNEVQYFNRLQMSDWLTLFDKEGFSLIYKYAEIYKYAMRALRINTKYQHYKKEDLSCTQLIIVHRKPN